MENSEKLDCAAKTENIPNEGAVVNTGTCAFNDKLLSCPGSENLESVVSGDNSVNEDLNLYSKNQEDGESNKIAAQGNILDKIVTLAEVQDKPQHTFKKPDLLIGPRRGKSTILEVVSNFPHHSTISTDKFPEKSKDTEIVHSSLESSHQTENEDGNHRQIYKEKDNQPHEEKYNEIHEKKDNRAESEKEKQIPLPYKEPLWSGKPEAEYKAEVLKSGLILETIDLSKKNFYVIGRLPVCDISLAHPTISRYHAIFQYRSESDEKNEKGLYLYDLGSTHGSFWNGNRIRPNVYVRIRGGHMIKFGNSQRKFIILTPSQEEEEESELSVTELKEKRRLELEERTRVELEHRQEEEQEEKRRLEKEESEGIDWGMADDADEESDLTENPYAQTNNEELFLDDPKKTLRGWFEREGLNLQYQAEEQGIGRFVCWVDLPLEEYVGRSIKAEATVKGKKKEAVIQCALEACRILDRYGLLRQAVHEGRKRKTRNWEEEDFYDSDEDNYLDRTGTVEKKREQRMRVAGKLNTKAETYTSLTERHAEITKQIEDIQSRLKQALNTHNLDVDDSNEDVLDAFMSQLKNSTFLNKSDITGLKMNLQKLRKEETQLLKLIDISKPVNLPALKLEVSHFEKLGTKRESNIKSFDLKKAVKGAKFSETNLEDRNIEKETSINKFSDNSESCTKSDDLGVDELSKPKAKIIKKGENSETDSKSIVGQSTEIDKCEPMEEEERNQNDDSKEKMEDNENLRKKKRNLKRIQQRALKTEKDKIKSYEEEKYQKDYCTWVPPEGQSGDGKTALNDKFGY